MSTQSLTLSDKFLHVIYEYRYFVLAGRAWSQFGSSGTIEAQRAANALLPGIAVLVQDSLLMHARALIDFYTKSSGGTNIVLKDFGFSAVRTEINDNLQEYKQPIEVHLLHITDWRDSDYREANMATECERERQRIDWNTHNSKIVHLLLQALDEVSKQTIPWGKPFRHLYCSAKLLLNDPSVNWPMELCEKTDVDTYLNSIGLN